VVIYGCAWYIWHIYIIHTYIYIYIYICNLYIYIYIYIYRICCGIYVVVFMCDLFGVMNYPYGHIQGEGPWDCGTSCGHFFPILTAIAVRSWTWKKNMLWYLCVIFIRGYDWWWYLVVTSGEVLNRIEMWSKWDFKGNYVIIIGCHREVESFLKYGLYPKSSKSLDQFIVFKPPWWLGSPIVGSLRQRHGPDHEGGWVKQKWTIQHRIIGNNE